MSWLETHTHARWEIDSPETYRYTTDEIAHALARLCRYAGHTPHLYSVAQHSLAVYTFLSVSEHRDNKTLLMAALLHDASEAYLVDIPAPIKRLPIMEGYRALERRVQRAILGNFLHPHDVERYIDHPAIARGPRGPSSREDLRRPVGARAGRAPRPGAADDVARARTARHELRRAHVPHAPGRSCERSEGSQMSAPRLAMLCGLRPDGWCPPRPGVYKIDPTSVGSRREHQEDLARDRHVLRQRALQDEALRLREEGLSYRSIAEQLNYSEAKSAAAAVDRARARRERALENADQDIEPPEATQDEDDGGLWGLSFQAIAEELPTERPRKGRVA